MAVYGGQVTGQKKDIASSIGQLAAIMEQNRAARVKKAQDTWGVLQDVVTNQFGGNYAKAFRSDSMQMMVKQFLRYNIGGAIPNGGRIDEMYEKLKNVPMTYAQNIQEIMLGLQRGDFDHTPTEYAPEEEPAKATPEKTGATQEGGQASMEAPSPAAAPSVGMEAPTPPEKTFPSTAAPGTAQETYEKYSTGKLPSFEAAVLKHIEDGYVNPADPEGSLDTAVIRVRHQFDRMIQGMPDGPDKEQVRRNFAQIWRRGLEALKSDPVWQKKLESAWGKAKSTWSQSKSAGWVENNQDEMVVRPRNTEWELTPAAAGEGSVMTRTAQPQVGERLESAPPKTAGNPATAALRAGLTKWLGGPTKPGGYPYAAYQRIRERRPELFDPESEEPVVKDDADSQLAFVEEAKALLSTLEAATSSPSSSSSSSTRASPGADAAPLAATSARRSSLFPSEPSGGGQLTPGSATEFGISTKEVADLARKSGTDSEGVRKGFETMEKDPADRSAWEEGQARKVLRAASWKLSAQGEELRRTGGKIGDLSSEQALKLLNDAQEGIEDWKDNPFAMEMFSTPTSREERKLRLEERQFIEAKSQFDRSIGVRMQELGLEWAKLESAEKAAALEAYIKSMTGNVDTTLIEKFATLYNDRVMKIPGFEGMSPEQRKAQITTMREGDPIFGVVYDTLLKYGSDALGGVIGGEEARTLRGNATFADGFVNFWSWIFKGAKYKGTAVLPTLGGEVARDKLQAYDEATEASLAAARKRAGME